MRGWETPLLSLTREQIRYRCWELKNFKTFYVQI